MALLTTAFLDSKTYGFEWLRQLLELSPLQEGAVSPGDYKVTPGTLGGQRVDVAAGIALVKGDSGTRNALYAQINDAAMPNAVTLTASHGTLPRVDQIILRVRDSSDLGDGSDTPALEVLTGTATDGATLDNRTGAAALPNNAMRLADVLVPAASASVTAGNIRDRRQWARGARWLATLGAISQSTLNTWIPWDDGAGKRRLELSGVPCRILLDLAANANSGGRFSVRVQEDAVDAMVWDWTHDNVSIGESETWGRYRAPAAGSHLYEFDAFCSNGNPWTIYTGARFYMEEDLRPSADNGTT